MIDQFSAPSEKVAKQARDLEKRFKNVGDTFKNVGAIFTSAGESLTKNVTAPLTVVGGAAVKFASESQGAFQQFAAATGTAVESMGAYKNAINDVYKENFGENINEVAESMANVKKNMDYLDNSALESVTKYAMTLSDTFNYDVSESTRAADTLIKNYGLSAREAFNLITQGTQSGLDYSGELMDTINEYSPQFQKMGFSANDMFSIFASGAENGAFNLDKIGDAVKEFSVRAVDGSDTTKAGFEAIGLDAAEMAKKIASGGTEAKTAFDQVIKGLAGMEDPVAQNIAGVNLFGTMWEDLTPKVVTSLSTTNKSIDAARESMEGLVAVKYDSLSGALGGLWRTIQVDVLQPIGNMLIPYVTKGIDKIKEMTKWWNDLGPAAQETIVKFAGVAAAIGPVLLGIGKLHSGIGGAITTFGKMQGAITRAGGLFKMLKSPASVATMAIAGVATAAVLIYTNWDKIKAATGKVVDAFKDFAKGAGQWFGQVKDNAMQLWENVKNVFNNVANTIKETMTSAIDTLKGVVSFVGDAFKQGIQSGLEIAKGYFMTWYDGIKGVIENVKGVLEGVSDFISGVFTGNWEKAWNGLKDIVGNAFGALEGLVKTPINAVINLVNKAIGAINKISIDLPDFVGGGHLGFDIPTIPQLAKGTDNWKGGIAQVHERGGEIIDLPQGTRVYPHDESVRMARAESKKSIAITIAKLADQIIVREDTDIDRIADALATRLERTAYNMT